MQPATKKEISPMTIDAIIGRDDREVELRDEQCFRGVVRKAAMTTREIMREQKKMNPIGRKCRDNFLCIFFLLSFFSFPFGFIGSCIHLFCAQERAEELEFTSMD